MVLCAVMVGYFYFYMLLPFLLRAKKVSWRVAGRPGEAIAIHAQHAVCCLAAFDKGSGMSARTGALACMKHCCFCSSLNPSLFWLPGRSRGAWRSC